MGERVVLTCDMSLLLPATLATAAATNVTPAPCFPRLNLPLLPPRCPGSNVVVIAAPLKQRRRLLQRRRRVIECCR
jgi:hypothetical protein